MELLIISLYILFGISSFALALVSILTILKILNIYDSGINLKQIWIVVLVVFFVSILMIFLIGLLT